MQILNSVKHKIDELLSFPTMQNNRDGVFKTLPNIMKMNHFAIFFYTGFILFHSKRLLTLFIMFPQQFINLY